MKATQENYNDLCKKCESMLNDEHTQSFMEISFINYAEYFNELKTNFPNLIFELKNYGIKITKKETKE